MTAPVPTAAPPTPPAPPTPTTPDAPLRPGLLIAIAVVSLVIATASWYGSGKQIEQLSRQIAALDETQQKMGAALRNLTPGGGAAAKPSSAIGMTIDLKGSPARGLANATVALVEFSDYECPFCLRYFQQTMPRIDSDYIQSGKIRYVFRDFPIDQLHPESIKAHEAAHCAGEQSKFWELHNRLFSPAGSHAQVQLDAKAKEAGLNVDAFKACIASGRTIPAINASVGFAQILGGTGTPTFFIGTRDPATDQFKVVQQLVGAQPYVQFQQAIDAVLAKAK